MTRTAERLARIESRLPAGHATQAKIEAALGELSDEALDRLAELLEAWPTDQLVPIAQIRACAGSAPEGRLVGWPSPDLTAPTIAAARGPPLAEGASAAPKSSHVQHRPADRRLSLAPRQ